MYFAKTDNIPFVIERIKPKLSLVMKNSKMGVQVDIKAMSQKRSLKQNKYLWGIYSNIVNFWQETGFVPDNLPVRFINSDFLHEYFKLRLDTPSTAKLSTTEMMQYCDRIQNLMLEQTKGKYEPIHPEELETYQEM